MYESKTAIVQHKIYNEESVVETILFYATDRNGRLSI